MGDFQSIFRNLRIERGFTQAELAKKLNISRSTIGMYETGSREPDYETLEKIADFFNVDIDYLMGRKDRSVYYLNPETAQIAQEVFDNPDLRILFDAARDVSPDNIKLAAEMLKRFKETNPDC